MPLDPLLRWFRRVTRIAIVVGLAWLAFVLVMPSSQELPWTPLSLEASVGLFAGRKIAALRHNPAKCLAVLRDGSSRRAGRSACQRRLCGERCRLALSGSGHAVVCSSIGGAVLPDDRRPCRLAWQVLQSAA